MTSSFKGLDLVNRVPKELWMKFYNIVQEIVTKTIPKKKTCKRQSYCLRTIKVAEEGREARDKGERKGYTQLNAEFQRIAWSDKNDFFN